MQPRKKNCSVYPALGHHWELEENLIMCIHCYLKHFIAAADFHHFSNWQVYVVMTDFYLCLTHCDLFTNMLKEPWWAAPEQPIIPKLYKSVYGQLALQLVLVGAENDFLHIIVLKKSVFPFTPTSSSAGHIYIRKDILICKSKAKVKIPFELHILFSSIIPA